MSKDKKRRFICGKCRQQVREKSGNNICKACKHPIRLDQIGVHKQIDGIVKNGPGQTA
jgi:uncharacterized CHY-type Zn-finger protein